MLDKGSIEYKYFVTICKTFTYHSIKSKHIKIDDNIVNKTCIDTKKYLKFK